MVVYLEVEDIKDMGSVHWMCRVRSSGQRVERAKRMGAKATVRPDRILESDRFLVGTCQRG